MNDGFIERRITRRRLLAIGGAGGVTLLAGCGSGAQSETGWTFVDDRKHAIKLKQRPTRIVAYTTAAAALHDWGVTPVGVFGDNPREDPSLAGFPWNKAQIVGSVYGEIDIQALQSLKPELIVSRWYPPPHDAPVFGFRDLKQEKTIGALVPIVAMNGHVIATSQIRRFGDLARALGVSTSSGRISQARSAFARSAASLSQIARRESNLRIIAVSADQRTIYVSRLGGDLAFYARRGVPLVSARTSDPYWDSLPWKKAGKYAADGILYDARSDVLPLAAAKGIPTFAELPAVQANQIGAWHADPPPSYQRYMTTMNDLAKAIAGWRKVT
jgi:iron-desferrioxamine transport system substrate-binding protein